MLLFLLMRSPCLVFLFFFFFNDTATTEIYTLSLHDALPISDVAEAADLSVEAEGDVAAAQGEPFVEPAERAEQLGADREARAGQGEDVAVPAGVPEQAVTARPHALEHVVGETAEAEDDAGVLDLAVRAGELQSGNADLGPGGPGDQLGHPGRVEDLGVVVQEDQDVAGRPLR